MRRRVLLTGATGFVGRQVLRELREHDLDIVLVTRPGADIRLDAECRALQAHVTPDAFAASDAWWADACAGIDTVIHVAWYAEPGQYLRSARNLECLEGTLRLARGAVQAGVRRVVGIGTCLEYDTDHPRLAVDTPVAPRSVYAAAKAACYLALSRYLAASDVEFLWCRLFHLFGEHEDARRLVPTLHQRLAAGLPVDLTGGAQIRDFLDVAVAGRLIAQAALSGDSGAKNICSGEPVTVRALAERIADGYGRRDLLRFGARPDDPLDPPCIVGVP